MGEPERKGLGNAKFTNAFRVINFELFAKPNKGIMLFGAICITGCFGFFLYLNMTHEGTQKKQFGRKGSRWDE
ncbi:hypothetical protein EMCRGX_G029557 [Ephydatia muelleri]